MYQNKTNISLLFLQERGRTEDVMGNEIFKVIAVISIVCIILLAFISREWGNILDKIKIKAIVITGVICVSLLAASMWYSVSFNESRLVSPTDFSTFKFTLKDLPMVISTALVAIYIIFLTCLLPIAVNRQKKIIQSTNRTRRLNPKLGFLGFLGFLGLLGFFDIGVDNAVYSFRYFTFFCFFGFFGFFYEGKMSNTLMDERFRENANRAQFVAIKTAFIFDWAATFIIIYFNTVTEYEFMRNVILAVMSFSIAIAAFLSEYLLYRYDYDDNQGCKDD